MKYSLKNFFKTFEYYHSFIPWGDLRFILKTQVIKFSPLFFIDKLVKSFTAVVLSYVSHTRADKHSPTSFLRVGLLIVYRFQA